MTEGVNKHSEKKEIETISIREQEIDRLDPANRLFYEVQEGIREELEELNNILKDVRQIFRDRNYRDFMRELNR